ncbi:uncharacterized protein B0H18DRAFT_1086705 [Fomitopsis serialis]|uniref:uncharacterized protein n=1 Tax=Fomitopsis serialis TaxID=139415 RepID=UPI002008831A|nr:uncharacterized protein B0H18DRAFT_1086705 [Neoantrodia serialis]KAH9919255.1 hypothetical protein B0H18DRAFT_1086705 [Neoantrodia serialis]
MSSNQYDVIIVGAGMAGLKLKRPAPLRICLLERSLAEPDRIVGEALRRLGMAACLEGIDAVPVRGYCVVLNVKPLPHGPSIQSLRKKARAALGVETVEATASELVECPTTGRVLGVRATRKVEGGEQAAEKETFLADLTIVADGCFSNFRTAVLDGAGMKSVTKSHFVGIVLEDAEFPIPKHGTVVLVKVLVKGHGPVLLYQIASRDTRMLVDLKTPLPPDIEQVILDEIGQHTKEGVFLVGDSWNMRHPLTGGGMTVAFNDVVVLQDLLREILHVLHRWHCVALYDLFGADDEALEVLRMGCFKYFELGGDCVRDPVSLLAGIEQSTLLLARHFFAVALYAIWVMFTHPRRIVVDEKAVYVKPGFEEYPILLLKCIRVFWTACVVFLPLVWTEIRWW